MEEGLVQDYFLDWDSVIPKMSLMQLVYHLRIVVNEQMSSFKFLTRFGIMIW